MGRISKVDAEGKIRAVKDYLAGRATLRCLGDRYGVHHSSIEKWITLYQSFGEGGLYDTVYNQRYPLAVKQQAVQSYFNSEMTMHNICRQYKLRSLSQLQSWIEKYEKGILN